MKTRRLSVGERKRDGDGYYNRYGSWRKSVLSNGEVLRKTDVEFMQYRRPIRAVAGRSAPHNKRSRPFPGLADIVHELKLTRAQAVVAGKVYAAITGKLAGVT